MFSRSDYVMRLVKQLAEVIASSLKLRVEGEREKSRQVLVDACGELFGIEHHVLEMLDAPSAVELLGERSRVEAYARLLDAMGHFERATAVRNA